MTLIIVKNGPKGYRIEADTKLTLVKRQGLEREEDQTNAIPGILKLYLLDKNYCLGFAGVYEYGLQALREIYKENTQSNLQGIEEIVSGIHSNSFEKTSDGTDFILCCRDLNKTKIWRNNGFLETTGDCFIGDNKSFDAIDPQSEDKRYLYDLLQNNDYERVGGMCVSVYDNGKSLAYQSGLSVYFQDEKWADSSNNYCCTTVTPRDAVPRLGVYFQDISVGYLHDPINTDQAIKFESIKLEEFREQTGLVGGISMVVRKKVAFED